MANIGTANSGGRVITDYEATVSVSGGGVAEETRSNPFGNVLSLEFTPGTYHVRLRLRIALR